MPWTMIHLGVAGNLTDKFKINKIPDFYLGAVAPDAVHYRANYIREYKDISHLCLAGDSHEIILNNAKDFILKNISHEHRDFYIGYGVHVMTDVYWAKTVYAEFAMRYLEDKNPIYPKKEDAYFNDMCILDLELYRKYKYASDNMTFFIKSSPIGIDGLVSAEEVRACFDGIRQIKNRFDENKNANESPKYIFYDDVLNFIDETAVKIDQYLTPTNKH